MQYIEMTFSLAFVGDDCVTPLFRPCLSKALYDFIVNTLMLAYDITGISFLPCDSSPARTTVTVTVKTPDDFNAMSLLRWVAYRKCKTYHGFIEGTGDWYNKIPIVTGIFSGEYRIVPLLIDYRISHH